jgi:hypothetical protein
MATVNAISVALFNAAAGGYAAQIARDSVSLANAVGLILEKDIPTDAVFIEHLLSNFGVSSSSSVYFEAKRALENLVISQGRAQAAIVAIDFLKSQEGAANEYGAIAMNFANKVESATQFSNNNTTEKDITKLISAVTGVDTDQVAITNAVVSAEIVAAAKLASAVAATQAKAAADQAAAIAAQKAVADAIAQNAADKAATDLQLALQQAATDAAVQKAAAEKALADASAALKAANDRAAEAAVKAELDKQTAIDTIDKTTDNAAAITAFLKAQAALAGLTGYETLTDTQLVNAIKSSDNQTIAGVVDKTTDNPAAITAYLRAAAADLGVSGTLAMQDDQLLNAIKTANDVAVAAAQKAVDDALAAVVAENTAANAAAAKAEADQAAAEAAAALNEANAKAVADAEAAAEALIAAVAAQKAIDDALAASVKATTDAAAATAAASLKTANAQIVALQNMTGTSYSLSTANDTILAVSGGNDTVTGTNLTYGTEDLIVDTSTADLDVLTLSTADDISALPVIAGIENINVNVTSVFAGSTDIETLTFDANNIRNGTVNFDVTNASSVVYKLGVTNVATGVALTSASEYTNVDISGDDNAVITFTGSPTTLLIDSDSGNLTNLTATVTATTVGTVSSDADGTITLTTSADTTATLNSATTATVTSAGQATVYANTADTVTVTSTEETLLTANAAENVTISSGDGIDSVSATAIESTLTSSNLNNIIVNVSGRSSATILDVTSAPTVHRLNVSGAQNITLKVGLDDVDGLGSSTIATDDDNLLTVSNTSTGTVNLWIKNSGGDADFSAASVSSIVLGTDLSITDDLTIASGTSIVSAADQTYDLALIAKNASNTNNTVSISVQNNATSNVSGDLSGGITLTSFKSATLTNNDTDAAAYVGAISASGTDFTIASGTQGFIESSTIALGSGTLYVTGTGPVNLGTQITATEVSASSSSGAITLALAGAATVGAVTTGSGADAITLNGARTAGDYTITTNGGNDSLTITTVEGFTWTAGSGYDTLNLDSTIDLSGQSITLSSMDAIQLDTSGNAAETLTLSAATFNTNNTFTLLGNGTMDYLVVEGTSSADTINASGVAVEIAEANLRINGYAGDDVITGSDFADTLYGGAGIDTIAGGNYGDTYLFYAGDVGNGESIVEASNGSGTDTFSVLTNTDFSLMTAASFDNIEAITLASGVSAIFTGLQLTGESLTLTGSGSTETLTVNMGVGETLVSGLATGTNFETITYNGSTGDEYITGSALAETIVGGAGNDVIGGKDYTSGVSNDTVVDTIMFSIAASNGIDSIYLGVKDGTAIDDVLNFTANGAFIGTTSESLLLVTDTDVTSAVATSLNTSRNILILTADYFDDALALSTASTLFTDCDTGDLLIIYAASSTGNARIAVATLNAGGDVTAATDVAILVGLTITEASTGFSASNFVLD